MFNTCPKLTIGEEFHQCKVKEYKETSMLNYIKVILDGLQITC